MTKSELDAYFNEAITDWIGSTVSPERVYSGAEVALLMRAAGARAAVILAQFYIDQAIVRMAANGKGYDA